jgi:hypothetical protein
MTKSASAIGRVPQASSGPQAGESPAPVTGQRSAGPAGLRGARPGQREARRSRAVSLRQIFTLTTLGPGTDTLGKARRNVSTAS